MGDLADETPASRGKNRLQAHDQFLHLVVISITHSFHPGKSVHSTFSTLSQAVR